MNLSVIIACYNGADFISNQLDALANQRYAGSWEVIISDNGSTDNSLEIVNHFKNRIPQLHIVDSSDKQSRAHARNIGVGISTGENILFLDQDDEVGPGWMETMSNALSEHDFVACRFDIQKLNDPWAQKSRFSPQSVRLPVFRYPAFLPHAAGCTLGVKRSIFDAIGGLDESFVSLDDTDFCFRAQLHGAQLFFVKDATLHYRYRTKLKDIFIQAVEYAQENTKLYIKYRPFGMPKLTRREIIDDWTIFLKKIFTVRIFTIRNKARFADFLWQFGWRVGRIIGSFKYKVFAI